MLQIELDPTGHYGEHNVNPEYLVPMLGLLPQFLAESDPADDAREAFDKAYGFGLYEMTGGNVDKNSGIFTYPEDPDMYPIAECIRGDEIIYFYESAIVAIVSKTSTFVTRMD